MQTEEIPPTYSEYPTNLPESFPIGALKVQPLVNVTELQAHLRLLGAINQLKRHVQAQEEGVAATDPALAWVVFVNRAVHRFYTWASTSDLFSWSQLSEAVIPPLDVVMVWHSYLLNPRAFYEDSIRMGDKYAITLMAIQSMPLTLISSLIDPQTLQPLPPTTARQATFENATSMSFLMPAVTGHSDVLSLICPFCNKPNHLVKWVADGEKGFAQPKFEHRCDYCYRSFAKQTIGMRRLAEEFTKKRAGQRLYISETLLEPRTGVMNVEESDAFTKRVFKDLGADTPCTWAEVPTQALIMAGSIEYDPGSLSKKLHTPVRPNYTSTPTAKPLPRIQRLCVAYSHAGPASLDLVGAVLRQGVFVDKMVGLGWTRPARFDHSKDSAPLVRSVARYHAFLDLMSCNPTALLVPTLDIDLAWHSHQLKGEQYRYDTMQYLGRTPNHDDNIEASLLSMGYDITAKAWRARFGVPYSVCGCTPDPDAESRISRFASRISHIGGKKDKGATPPPYPVNTRPDLLSIEAEEADSSHPSEHNLQVGNPAAPLVKKEAAKREKKSMKCVASAKKGAARDPWRGLQAERNEERRKAGHREAFTDPYYGYGYYYPYWGVSMAIPFG